MVISYGFRDERINIIAMTHGSLPGEFPFQIILCKKRVFPAAKIGPFLLVPKISRGQYQRSNKGVAYEASVANLQYENNYAAIVDSFIGIKVGYNLFDTLSSEGLFPLWDPSSPLKYFEGAQAGYLSVFRVFQLPNPINDSLFARGASGRNFYFMLDKEVLTGPMKPVLNDDIFHFQKSRLIDLVSKEQALVSILDADELKTQPVSQSANKQNYFSG